MDKPDPKVGTAPLLEWIAAGIGLLLIVLLVSVIGREAIGRQADGSPQVAIQIDSISPTADGYIVTFAAINRASATAVSLNIEGSLKRGDAIVEQSSATIDYLPGNGRLGGGLFFTQDPRRHGIVIRATGFQNP